MKEKILAATHGGLDAIVYYYPQARAVVEGEAKHFKIRDEKTPSATISQKNGVWYATDFGDDGTPRNCFDVCMKEESLNFPEACHRLAAIFKVDCTYKAEINKPDIETRAPRADETVGKVTWKKKEGPSADDLAALGPCVTAAVLARYNVFALEEYTKTFVNQGGRVTTLVVRSNANYPIFLLDFGTFQKVICPYAYEKRNRFFYVGQKEKDIIYGLEQVKAKYDEQVKYVDEEAMNEGDESKRLNRPLLKKLDEVILCSGERDALNCAGMGFAVIWLNSETARFGEKEMAKLKRYTDKVVNIPDLDSTGVKAAYRRALDNWELYTLLLPEQLRQWNDRRGKARKDLQDWCEMGGNKFEMKKMLDTATRCQFWDVITKKSRDGEQEQRYEINTINLLWYLRCNGFVQIEDNVSGQSILARIEGFIVKQYTAKQIRQFIKSEMDRLHIPNTIKKLFQDSKKTNASLMEDLGVVELDFEKSTPESRLYYFKNTALRVTAEGVETVDKNTEGHYAWEENISPHVFKRLAPSIELDENLEFKVKHTESAYMKVLINASRMYWRQEIEERRTGNPQEDKAYQEANHFNICGDRLNKEEKREQIKHFMNKCYAIGYMLHQYKFPSNAKALWILENRLTEDGESAGGSGKSFFVTTIKKMHLLNIVTLQGRQKNLTENNHLLDRIDKRTDILFIDDPKQHFDFDFFYTMITGSTTVNPKGEKSFEIDYQDSPIPVFSSNFPPDNGHDKSTLRRLQMVVFSDYYHEKGEGEYYHETRTIHDDLGMDVCGAFYTEDQYNADLNFLVDCTQYYLQCVKRGITVQPPMDNVWKRINISDMGNSGFQDWAETYFAAESPNVNAYVARENAMNDFARSTGTRNWTSQRFKKALKGFCDFSSYIAELNPKELQNPSNKRIIKRIDNSTKECIYVRTFNEFGDPEPTTDRVINMYGMEVNSIQCTPHE